MLKRVVFLFLCLICISPQVSSQTQKSKRPHIRSISLRDVDRYANKYTPHTLKISNVLLKDVRRLLDVWDEYVLELYDPRADFRLGVKGAETSFDPYGFLICVDELAKPLIEQRERWLNHRVNVYLRLRDMGLTTNMYVGYVAKMELLDEKGKVVSMAVSSRW